jgi:uncharacterized membrane protein
MATERGFDRLVNFSDAVVAIAATLLVLPFVDNATDAKRGNVDATISELAPEFLVFVLSFVVITRFWFSHHSFFERLVGYSPRLVWFNLMWLLGIVIMPFPTQLVAIATGTDKLAVVVYIGVMLWISFSQFLMSYEVYRTPRLLAEDVHPLTSVVISATVTGCLLAALIIALFWPNIGLWSLTLLFFVPLITKPILRKKVHAADLAVE